MMKVGAWWVSMGGNPWHRRHLVMALRKVSMYKFCLVGKKVLFMLAPKR